MALMTCLVCAVAVSPQAPRAPERARVPAGDRLDVNRAGMEELLKLPGMTQIWAGRIVRFRPYRSKLDLVNKGVIPARVYHRIEELIVAHHE